MIKQALATVKAGSEVRSGSHNGCCVCYTVLQTNKTTPQSISLYPNRRITEVLFPRAGFFKFTVNAMAAAADDFKSVMLSQYVLQTSVTLIRLWLGFARLESCWTDATDAKQCLV